LRAFFALDLEAEGKLICLPTGDGISIHGSIENSWHAPKPAIPADRRRGQNEDRGQLTVAMGCFYVR
jgi:hypothetical protein